MSDQLNFLHIILQDFDGPVESTSTTILKSLLWGTSLAWSNSWLNKNWDVCTFLTWVRTMWINILCCHVSCLLDPACFIAEGCMRLLSHVLILIVLGLLACLSILSNIHESNESSVESQYSAVKYLDKCSVDVFYTVRLRANIYLSKSSKRLLWRSARRRSRYWRMAASMTFWSTASQTVL